MFGLLHVKDRTLAYVYICNLIKYSIRTFMSILLMDSNGNLL